MPNINYDNIYDKIYDYSTYTLIGICLFNCMLTLLTLIMACKRLKGKITNYLIY